jgi:integrase
VSDEGKMGALLWRKNLGNLRGIDRHRHAAIDDPGRLSEEPPLPFSHLHSGVCRTLGLPSEFVLHSMRHTMLSKLGQSGADAFTIQRVAGHHSVTLSQRYVHPSRGSRMCPRCRRATAVQFEPATNLVTVPLLPPEAGGSKSQIHKHLVPWRAGTQW